MKFFSKGLALSIFAILLPSLLFSGDFKSHSGALKGWGARIQNKEAELKRLIDEKQKIKDQKLVKEKLDQIVATYNELLKLEKEYEEERSHVRFEHPEKGEELIKKYHPYRALTMEEYENEVGVDSKLTGIKSKVAKVYSKTAVKPSLAPAGQPMISPSPASSRPKLSY